MNAPIATETTAPATLTLVKPAKQKRPSTRMRKVTVADIAWEPIATPLFYQRVNADATAIDTIRAGRSYAIVRSDEDFPLGIASDQYHVTSHNVTRHAILTFAADLVTANGIMMSGHGYRVTHGYHVQHALAKVPSKVGEVLSKLVVCNDHTGSGALTASLVSYVGDAPIGSIVRERALHVGAQPEQWHTSIEGMIETAMLVQGALVDVVTAASEKMLDAESAVILRRYKIKVRLVTEGKGKKAKKVLPKITVLEAVHAWLKGHTKEMSWGVYSRRFDDAGIRAMCHVCGLARFGTPIDEILRQKDPRNGSRYGHGLIAGGAMITAV